MRHPVLICRARDTASADRWKSLSSLAYNAYMLVTDQDLAHIMHVIWSWIHRKAIL